MGVWKREQSILLTDVTHFHAKRRFALQSNSTVSWSAKQSEAALCAIIGAPFVLLPLSADKRAPIERHNLSLDDWREIFE